MYRDLKQHPVRGFYYSLFKWRYCLFIMDDYGNAVQLVRDGVNDWNKLEYTLHP